MASERIYQTDQYAVSNETEVTKVLEKDGFDVIICGSSVFFPEGGGQPSDIGTVASEKGLFEITYAYDESLDSDVMHVTDAPAGTFAPGDKVVLTIDFDRRFINMQRHLGEHMLSGTMDSLFGGVNKGFHMGEDYITIDIDIDGRMLTDEELDLAEHTVNEAIWADLPVTVTWFDDYESSLALPVRKKVPHDGRVSVVTVGDPDDPYDCIACCGTHPARSSEVGLLAIYKCEPNKGMNRIFFDCGSMAREKLSRDSHMLSAIAKKYSCGPSDLENRLEREEEDISDLKTRLASLTSYVKDAEISKIINEINENELKKYVYRSETLSADDLLKMGFSVVNGISDLFIIMVHKPSLTCLLLSSDESVDCGKTVKEHAPGHSGKGGGRPDNARALFTEASDMDAFIDEVLALAK